MLWENGGFFIRDIHRFDETVVSVTHDSALTSSSLAYGTLPVMDGSLWSGKEPAGIRPLLMASDGSTAPMSAEGPPQVKELNKTDLAISQPLTGGGSFVMVCREANVTCTGVDGQGKPLLWAWDMLGGDPLKAAVRKVAASAIIYQSGGADYELRLPANGGTFQQLPTGAIRILPNSSGQLVLSLGGL